MRLKVEEYFSIDKNSTLLYDLSNIFNLQICLFEII